MTVTLTKEAGNEFVLEAGALVLADQGIFKHVIAVSSLSPVSPVFHNLATVRIGLTKTQLEWEHPFHKIRCP